MLICCNVIEHVIEQDILVICPSLAMACGSAVLMAIGCVFGPIGKILNLFCG